MEANRWVRVLARATDHMMGARDEDPPELPRLTVGEAMVSLWIRLALTLLNVATCGFVIASVVRHW